MNDTTYTFESFVSVYGDTLLVNEMHVIFKELLFFVTLFDSIFQKYKQIQLIYTSFEGDRSSFSELLVFNDLFIRLDINSFNFIYFNKSFLTETYIRDIFFKYVYIETSCLFDFDWSVVKYTINE